MRAIAAIAEITFKEAMRSKALLVPFLFLLVVVASAPFTPAFSAPDRIRVMLSVATAAIGLLASVIAIFVSTSTISREIADKRLYMVLPRPINRLQYITGKVAGLWLLLAVIMLILGALTYTVARVSASVLLEPHEHSTVLAANQHIITNEVDYADRVASQLGYRNSMAEYQRVLEYSQSLYDKGIIPKGWVLDNLIEVLGAPDEELRNALPNASPDLIRKNISRILAELTGENYGESPDAWRDYFRRNPNFGRKPPNPDNAVEVPPADETQFYSWSYEGLSEKDLKGGLRGQITLSLFKNPRARLFERVTFSSAFVQLELKWGNNRSFKRLEAYDGRRLDFAFIDDAPPPKIPFTLTLTTPPGPASVVVGADDLWVLSAPSSFAFSIAKAMFLSWCVAALLAVTGVFAASFLSFPIALMLCLFVFFWGNTVEYMQELTRPTSPNPLLDYGATHDSHRPDDFMSRITDSIVKSANWFTIVLTKGIDSFPKYDGGKYIPLGENIPNSLLASALFKLLAWRAVLLILLGWLLFRRREF